MHWRGYQGQTQQDVWVPPTVQTHESNKLSFQPGSNNKGYTKYTHHMYNDKKQLNVTAKTFRYIYVYVTTKVFVYPLRCLPGPSNGKSLEGNGSFASRGMR